MNDASTAAAAALQLPDDAFYSATGQRFDETARMLAPIDPPDEEPSRENDVVPPVFALGLPGVIDVARVGDLPAALAVRYDALREWQVNLRRNLCLVVVDLHTGELRTTSPYKSVKPLARPPLGSRSGPAPEGLQARITMRGVERIVVRPVFGETWPSDTYAVTATAYDWVSNTKLVKRSAAAPASQPRWIPSSPDLESSVAPAHLPPGLRFDLAQAGTGGVGVRVKGTISMPVVEVALGIAGPTDPRRSMLAHLLLFKLDVASPISVGFAAPVTVQGGNATGHFSFDLGRRAEAGGLSGEYQVYLVSGRTVVGPQVLRVGRT